MANFKFSKAWLGKGKNGDVIYAYCTPMAEYEGKMIWKMGWSSSNPFGYLDDKNTAVGNITGELGEAFKAHCRASGLMSVPKAETVSPAPADTTATPTTADIEAVRKEAYEAGREAGKKEVLEAVESKLNAKLAEVENRVAEIRNRMAEATSALKARITELTEQLEEANAANDALLQQINEQVVAEQKAEQKIEAKEEAKSEVDAELEAFMAKLDEPTASTAAPDSAPTATPAASLSADAASMLQQLAGDNTIVPEEEGTYFAADDNIPLPSDDDCIAENVDIVAEDIADDNGIDLDEVAAFADQAFGNVPELEVKEHSSVPKKLEKYSALLEAGLPVVIAEKLETHGVAPEKVESVSKNVILMAKYGIDTPSDRNALKEAVNRI